MIFPDQNAFVFVQHIYACLLSFFKTVKILLSSFFCSPKVQKLNTNVKYWNKKLSHTNGIQKEEQKVKIIVLSGFSCSTRPTQTCSTSYSSATASSPSPFYSALYSPARYLYMNSVWLDDHLVRFLYPNLLHHSPLPYFRQQIRWSYDQNLFPRPVLIYFATTRP